MQTIADYTIEEHKHILATWAAARAASVVNKRFSVEVAKKILENLNIQELIKEIPQLKSSKPFDEWHDQCCNTLVEIAKGEIKGFSYGLAAKLLNCYLKVYFLDQLNKFSFIHPPVDRLLLEVLEKRNFDGKKKIWGKYKSIGWSNFSREEYQEVIDHIKASLHPEKALWKIEYYWPGHQ